MDARIGKLLDGTFYTYTPEHRDEPFFGSLREVEDVLGVPHTDVPLSLHSNAAARERKLFKVLLRFQYPSWDELDGIAYPDIEAGSKSAANALARGMADRDGHLVGGKGRCTFTAFIQSDET